MGSITARSGALFERLEARQMMSRVSGYLADYRIDSGILDKLDWSAVTHVDYFSILPEKFMPVGGTYTPPTLSTNFKDMTKLDAAVTKAHQQLKTISVVIGGAGYSDGFDGVFDTQAHIDTFITNLTAFCAAHNFDGVDLDWEPLWETATATKITNFSKLITSFKTAAPALAITAAVAPTPQPVDTIDFLPRQYVLNKAAIEALDYVNVMAYDFQRPNHSDLVQSQNALADWADYADPSGALDWKFVLGVPFYGTSTTTEATYQEIYAQYQQGPTVNNIGGWYFNSPDWITKKSQYVVNNRYGGVMVWELAQDYFNGNAYDTTHSLLPQIKTIMNPVPFAVVGSGVLTLNADGDDDTFTISNSGNSISVKLNSGSPILFTAASVTSIVVNGHGGDDTVEFNGVAKPVLFNGGSGFDTLNINSGTYTFNADAFVGNNALVVNVAAGAAVTFNSTQHLDGLNINGTATVPTNGSRMLVTHGLTMGVNAVLDLKDNDLIVDYSGSPSPMGSWVSNKYTGISGLVQSGRNQAAWNGKGIVTTMPFALQQKTTLATVEASQAKGLSAGQTAIWQGETVDSTTILVKYTYNGDANVDGVVNADDYAWIDLYTVTPNSNTYVHGDFNYSGTITADDYALIDIMILNQGGML